MENKVEQKFSTPMAIVVAGIFIALAVLLTQGSGSKIKNADDNTNKTPSQQLGVSKDDLLACIEENSEKIYSEIEADLKLLFEGQKEECGTPFSVIIDKNGKMKSVCGAIPYEDKEYSGTMYKGVKSEIEELINGPSPDKTNYLSFMQDYTGKMNLPSEKDHVLGNKDANVTIVEYSDFNCTYCNRFHGVLNQIIEENGDQVKWIFRHRPILGNESISKAIAAECVTSIKNDKAFWEYAELMFGLMKTPEEPSIADQL
jgi:hypothetical protein